MYKIIFKKGNESLIICWDMDEPWGRYAKWKKPITKRQILHDSTCLRYLKSLNSEKHKAEWQFPGAGGKGRMGVVQ